MSVQARRELSNRWSPFKEVEELKQRLSQLLGRNVSAESRDKTTARTSAPWSPAVDLSEDDNAYTLTAELPGVKESDITLEVHHNVLTITGERQPEKQEPGKTHHRVERTYGNFLRRFTLPEDADGAKMTANCTDGVLTVRLPKPAHAKPKPIDVTMGEAARSR